ncbi:MAG: hypothetical protein IJ981_02500 [Clostridia bacterium]|nr:hypothetical protein [Clostridia bacterium]
MIKYVKRLNFYNLTKILFLFTELILYLLFLSMDFLGRGDSYSVKYTCIITCLVFASTHFFASKDGKITTVALFFTLLADYFLLVKNDNYLLGVSLFVIVQIFYRLRLILVFDKDNKANVKPYITAFCVFATVIIAFKDKLIVVVLTYFLFLLSNVIKAFCITYKTKSKRALAFLVGLVLLALCDVCVGLSNLWQYVKITRQISRIMAVSSRLSWVFYLPSQVLVSLSITED